MNTVIFALIGVSGAVVVHAATMRFLPSRLALRSLAGIVLTSPFILVLILAALETPISFLDWLGCAILMWSLGLSYGFLFVGVVYDSPTLALANAIADHGASGMPIDELDRFIATHPFVSTRFSALKNSGVLVLEGDSWVARGGLGPVMRLGAAYRRLGARRADAG